MVFAYLRVSTLHQDEANQRMGVEQKAERLGISIDKYIIDCISGTQEPQKRNLGKLLRQVKPGDVIIVSELSRLGRRLFMLFRILETLLDKGVTVYSVKDGYCLDGSLQSKIMAFTFGIAAEIEREMLSLRTREALALRKAQGKILGRPKGAKSRVHKLDRYQATIVRLLKRGLPRTRIAKRCHVTDKTLRKYIRESNLCLG